MNPSGIASSAASSGAASAASGAATSGATKMAGNMGSNMGPAMNNGINQSANPSMNPASKPAVNNQPQVGQQQNTPNNNQNGQQQSSSNNQQNGTQNNQPQNGTNNEGGSGNKEKDIADELFDGDEGHTEAGDVAEEPPKQEKKEPGQQVNEDGEVEDSSTKKTLKAVGRGAAAYFSGGQSIGPDKDIANMAPVDKTLGAASDMVDKSVPGMKEVSRELDEAGVADGVNDALDAVASAKNGDIQGTVESAKKLKDDVGKTKQYVKKKAIMILIPVATMIFFLTTIVVAICGPVVGGFLDVVESIDDGFGEVVEWVADIFSFDNVNQEKTTKMISEIPGFENLNEKRQQILLAAASAVAEKIPYSYGSHPHSAGLMGVPSEGLDCAGFVQWALWTGLGGNPGYLTTLAISNKIGTDFIEITESELQPGDIGLKRRGGSEEGNYNHTGIYAGNDQWFHATGGKTKKVVRNNYAGFTIYLRYVGVD